ncbi:protein translocation protein Sec63p [Trichomonascus vanleenenianus]|uniref:protein-transporting protein SEC63 n=1 Tax=Trichomonascus vanleenenianus TaxID=2268995 RepID=UPI003ECB88E4
MSDSRYSYDENAEVWPYFAITLIGITLAPATWISTKRLLSSSPEAGVAPGVKFRAPNDALVQKFRAKQQRSKLLTKSNLVIAVGWVLIAALVYIIQTQNTGDGEEKKLFDPYEILGISFSATERQIRSQYRKLSLQFHPDKIKDLGNSTREAIEARYVEITKAYKALTDEVTRSNFLKYGHPDGPQQQSHGIALPTFLVEGKGSPIVMGAYALFVGVILPWFVGSWWSGVRSYTKNGIHQESAAVFFESCAKEQPHFITYDRILDMLSKAAEFKLLLPHRSQKEIRELIDAHLNREPVENENDKLVVVSRCPSLLNGLLDIASGFKSFDLCKRIIEVERCIVQAVPLKDQAYGAVLQLPGISIDEVGPNKTIKLSEDAQLVARKTIPSLKLLKAFFRVPGENGYVPPTAQAHLVVKFAVLPQGVPLPKNIEPAMLEDDDDEHHKTLQEPLSTNELPPTIPDVYAPYFPAYFRPSWYGFIVNERDGKILEGPAEMFKLDYSNLSLSDKELQDGSKLTIAKFKIQLTSATPPVGTYNFRLGLISSGYFGADIIETVEMKVEEPPAQAEPAPQDDEDDISEPEEDSLSGQMAQLRGEKVKKPANEYDSDNEEEEDLSDIDTDTEDEAE